MTSTTHSSLALRLLGQVPTLVVLAILFAVGAWGIMNDWKLSSGTPDEIEKSGWCSAHNVPEDICVTCKPELLPTSESAGWCRTHGVHECTLCNPQLAQLDSPYTISEADRVRAKTALESAPRPANGSKDVLHERKIQFASLDAYERLGVEVFPAFQDRIAETSPVHGEILNDPSRVAHVASRATGSVAKVFKHLGDEVKENELLALVDAAPVGQAKAEYQHWLAQLDVRLKTRNQMDTSVVPQPTVLAADAAVREARIKLASARQALINLGLPMPADDFKGLADEEVAEKLHFLGIPAEKVRELDRGATSNNLLPIRAAINGVITSRDIVAGEVVDPTKTLFEIIDSSVLWLNVFIRFEDVPRLRIGETKVVFEPDGASQPIEGTIAWVSTEADPRTRLVRARVNVDNKNGKLRANVFGHGQIILREEPNAILVPNAAVHVEGGNRYLFVRDRRFREEGFPKIFHTRTVRVGAKDESNTEIIAGVLPGELVATKNSTMLMAELLRGKIGEG